MRKIRTSRDELRLWILPLWSLKPAVVGLCGSRFLGLALPNLGIIGAVLMNNIAAVRLAAHPIGGACHEKRQELAARAKGTGYRFKHS